MHPPALGTALAAAPFLAILAGVRYDCFTHYVQDNGGRYCLRGPMVQSDAEWLANKMNTQLG
ncbi:hypothetical protein EEB12_16720 [Rhodococcus sp. WS1]|uniref:hypothetical protein n=1 Tax=Rhodococcus TaxID=1827 RepID=UPI00114193A3|nr:MULTISPECIES: hypothetical protein [Rhodococcus]MDJ0402977.1 hypothetical protein [Rhodococcus erythropolis]ROZ55433.1 hypothetical protein EEB12_16720 [Rhodococcus sp. WS1]TQC39792.1 hypothetical protein EEB16_08490 [Rhodococcus sp. WS7]